MLAHELFFSSVQGPRGDQWKTITMSFCSRINLGPNQGKILSLFFDTSKLLSLTRCHICDQAMAISCCAAYLEKLNDQTEISL